MKLFIWGTGRLVGKVIGRYIDIGEVEAFVDNDVSQKEYMGKKVISPDDLTKIQYDAVLVVNSFSKQIFEQCKTIGIDLRKVIFLYSNCYMKDMNTDYKFVQDVLGKEYADVIRNRYHIIRGVEAYGNLYSQEEGFLNGGYSETDYVREKCFELAVKEIRKRKTEGAVAEVGVFKGEFAQYINYAFPDKKCYLFDTFDGFNTNEALNEVKNGNCTEAFVEAYKQTTVYEVLRKMKYLDNVIIKQGFFPESAGDLEERFAFVSVDVDFEESIYNSLKWFYPRMVEGGYIFVHDYNSSLQGVERAVDRFEEDMGLRLCKMPLCDANGTLVIIK